MRGWQVAITTALVLAGSASAAATGTSTVVDLFQPVAIATMRFTPSCGMEPYRASQFILDPGNGSFEFREGGLTGTGNPSQAYVGCGSATATGSIPAGTDHVHVRFTADRVLNTQVSEFVVNFTQAMVVSFDTGESQRFDYFSVEEGSRPATVFDPPLVAVPAGATRITVDWLFQDHGSSRGPREVLEAFGQADPVSSQTVNATVSAISIEFSGAPVPSRTGSGSLVQGDQRSLRTRVEVTADPDLVAAYHTNLRVEVAASLRLLEIVTPDGQHLTQFTSNPLPGTVGFHPYGPDGLLPLVEPRVDFYRATLPGQAVAAHGAGTYTFVFAREVPLDAPDGLLVLVFVVLALPFVNGARALVGVRAFQREAFGLYRKAASGLLLGIALILAYYLLYVVQVIRASQHILMATWPPTAQGLLVFANVLLACAGLAAFGFVGQRLHAITRPAR